MSFFDKIKQTATQAAQSAVADMNKNGLLGAQKVRVEVGEMAGSVEEFKAKLGGDFTDPNKIAAFTVMALCAYPFHKDLAIDMLNTLKGPTPLSGYDKQFLADRFRQQPKVAISFLHGATPENDYTPTAPYTVDVYKTAHSEDAIGEGYLQLFVKSSGADNARPIRLRKKPSTGEWFLWEYFILAGIREAKSADPWA